MFSISSQMQRRREKTPNSYSQRGAPIKCFVLVCTSNELRVNAANSISMFFFCKCNNELHRHIFNEVIKFNCLRINFSRRMSDAFQWIESVFDFEPICAKGMEEMEQRMHKPQSKLRSWCSQHHFDNVRWLMFFFLCDRFNCNKMQIRCATLNQQHTNDVTAQMRSLRWWFGLVAHYRESDRATSNSINIIPTKLTWIRIGFV